MFIMFFAAAMAADPLPEVAEARTGYREALLKEKDAIVVTTVNDLKLKCIETALDYRAAKERFAVLHAEIDRIAPSQLDPKTLASLTAPLKAAAEKESAKMLDAARSAKAAGDAIPARKAGAKSASERAAWIDAELAALDKLEGKRLPTEPYDMSAAGLGGVIGAPPRRLMSAEDVANLPDEFNGCMAEFGPAVVSSK